MKRRNGARILAGVCTLLLAAALSGCGSTTDSTNSSGGAAPSAIKIGVGGNYVANNAGMWAAHNQFDEIEQKYGTKISFDQFGKGSDVLNAMLGGSVNFCVCGPSHGLTAASAGQKLVYAAATFKGAGQLLIGGKKYEESPGSDIAAFRGKSIGFTSLGSFSQIVGEKALDSAGLPWSEVDPIALGSPTAFGPALDRGRVDFAVVDIAGAVPIIKDGAGYVISDLSDPASGGKLVGDLLGNGITFPGAFIDAYPDLAQDIVTAFIKGLSLVRQAGSDAEAVYALMPEDFKKANSLDVFKDQWAYMLPTQQFDGGFTQQAIDNTIAVSDMPKDKIPTGFFDPKYVDKAYETLGIPRPSFS